MSNCTLWNNKFIGGINAIHLNRFPSSPLLRNNIFTKNFCAGTQSNIFYWNGSLNTPTTVDIQTDFRAMFTRIDSNYFSPTATKPFYYWYHLTPGGTFNDGVGNTGAGMNLSAYKTFAGSEAASINFPSGAYTIEYNTTTGTKPINFAGQYKTDEVGAGYRESVTLPIFGSKALWPGASISNVRNYFQTH